MSTNQVKKLFIIALIASLIFNCVHVFAKDLVNTENQYMELKVVSIKDVEGADKQVILEWWSYNLEFKGLDLRFSYDSSKIKPSNISSNEYIEFSGERVVITPENKDTKKDLVNFEYAGDFSNYMGYMLLAGNNGEYRCVMDIEEKDDSGTYIENNPDLEYVVNTNVAGRCFDWKNEFQII